MIHTSCLCLIPIQHTLLRFSLHVFGRTGPPRKEDCLAPMGNLALSVFPKDTTTKCPIRELNLQPIYQQALFQLSYTTDCRLATIFNNVKYRSYSKKKFQQTCVSIAATVCKFSQHICKYKRTTSGQFYAAQTHTG